MFQGTSKHVYTNTLFISYSPDSYTYLSVRVFVLQVSLHVLLAKATLKVDVWNPRAHIGHAHLDVSQLRILVSIIIIICSYQNSELWHVRVDVVEWGPELHTSAWRGTFDRRGDLQNKKLQCSSTNICKERKASICLIRLVWAKEREHKLVVVCAECVSKSCKWVRWNLPL